MATPATPPEPSPLGTAVLPPQPVTATTATTPTTRQERSRSTMATHLLRPVRATTAPMWGIQHWPLASRAAKQQLRPVTAIPPPTRAIRPSQAHSELASTPALPMPRLATRRVGRTTTTPLWRAPAMAATHWQWPARGFRETATTVLQPSLTVPTLGQLPMPSLVGRLQVPQP